MIGLPNFLNKFYSYSLLVNSFLQTFKHRHCEVSAMVNYIYSYSYYQTIQVHHHNFSTVSQIYKSSHLIIKFTNLNDCANENSTLKWISLFWIQIYGCSCLNINQCPRIRRHTSYYEWSRLFSKHILKFSMVYRHSWFIYSWRRINKKFILKNMSVSFGYFDDVIWNLFIFPRFINMHKNVLNWTWGKQIDARKCHRFLCWIIIIAK